jgi:hypothetical protein
MKFPRVKKFLRWTLRTLLALVVLLIVFILEENIRGRVMLSRYKAELRAKGEKLTLAEINIVLPSKEGTSNAELGAAGRELRAIQKESRFDLWSVIRLRWIGPGRVIVRCRQPDLDVRWHDLPVKNGESRNLATNGVAQLPRGRLNYQTPRTYVVMVADWGDLSERLDAASNALACVRTALTNGEVFFPDTSGESKSLQLGYEELKSVRIWLAAAGLDEIHDGKLDSAIREISLLAALARVHRDERLMYGDYRRIGIGETGLDLTWEALQAPDWTDSRLSELQAAWEMEDILPYIIPALEVERGFDIAFYDKVRSSFAEWQKVRRGMLSEYRRDTLFDIEVSLWFTLWRVAWLDQSEEALLRKYQSLLEAARNVVAGQAWKNVYHPPVGVDRRSYSYFNAGFGWFEEAWRVAMEFETRRQMTLTAIALKRFELRYGHLPADLRELAPDFLSGLPRDYMTDRSLRYRLKVDGKFILYSVGDDGHDDGGIPSAPLQSGFLNPFAYELWKGADAVWPVAATPKEIEAYESKIYGRKR